MLLTSASLVQQKRGSHHSLKSRVKNHPEYAERLNRPENHRHDSKSKNEIGRSLTISCNTDVESVPHVTSPCIVALNGLKGIA